MKYYQYNIDNYRRNLSEPRSLYDVLNFQIRIALFMTLDQALYEPLYLCLCDMTKQ